MEIGEILSYISQYGFSIVMCLLLFWYNKSTLAELTKTIESNTKVVESLKDAIKSLKD